jgi:DNA polymerase III alpha subunit
MLPVLQFLLYFIDKLKDNNIVWGVGRGSSVSSYVLFLMGVHRIDSVKYNLDIKEFLK